MIERRGYVEGRRGVRANVVLLLSLIAALPACLALGASDPTAFVVVGSDFHARDQDDAGEVRICLQNTSHASLSTAQLRLQVMVKKTDGSGAGDITQKCVYAKLSPPVLPPGQYGQLVGKLLDRPAGGGSPTCTVSAVEGATSYTLPLAEPALWISYVGFPYDCHAAFVYVENHSDAAIRVESLRIGEVESQDPAGFIKRLVPPRDKSCLTYRFPAALTPGEFLHVAVSGRKDDQDVRIHSVVRVINRIPFTMVESGTPDPGLGLDLQGFTETMTCIAHAHGSHEQAAGEFLEGYVKRFHQDPREVIQLDICRSDSPPAWFRFGSLPDVARMNPVLPPPHRYDEEDHRQRFNPFFYRGYLAKRAVEPGRYVAVLPLVPDEGLFLQKELTPQETRFLVYGALASGAKGLCYRGVPADDPLNRNAFVRLNRELRQIGPLLSMGDTVDWATATDNNYVASSLLCADRAILTMVFDRRYFSQQRNDKIYTPPFARAVTPVQVDVKIPREVAVERVRSLFAPLDRGTWVCREGRLSFTVDMIDSVQVYLVDLQRQLQPSGAGEAMP